MLDRVVIEIGDHVAHVRLARPNKMNALDTAMFTSLVEAGVALRDDPDLRAVVISGDGTGFCSGIDLDVLAEDGSREQTINVITGTRCYEGMNLAQYAAMQWQHLAVPVIAAVHGVAFGGGLQLALGADMRFVARDARFSIMEVKWGLVPDMGGICQLKSLVRRDVAAELVASGRIFSGEEALRLGVATRVCESPLAEALAFAREIAARSPDAIRAGKRLLSIGDKALADEILAAETIEQHALLKSRNHAEAVRAGLAQQLPDFARPAPAPR